MIDCMQFSNKAEDRQQASEVCRRSPVAEQIGTRDPRGLSCDEKSLSDQKIRMFYGLHKSLKSENKATERFASRRVIVLLSRFSQTACKRYRRGVAKDLHLHAQHDLNDGSARSAVSQTQFNKK